MMRCCYYCNPNKALNPRVLFLIFFFGGWGATATLLLPPPPLFPLLLLIEIELAFAPLLLSGFLPKNDAMLRCTLCGWHFRVALFSAEVRATSS